MCIFLWMLLRVGKLASTCFRVLDEKETLPPLGFMMTEQDLLP